MPVFSIVIPLYNKEATIAHTLKSVLKQTYINFEVLVVDDGSTDRSVRVTQSFFDPRIKVLSKKNGGVSSARNFGIEHAQGQYIAFLDADDHWSAEYLEEMKKLIDKYPDCGLYASGFVRVSKYVTTISGKDVAEGIVTDFFKQKMQHSLPFTSATIVRKSAIDEVGRFPMGMVAGEDDYTWCKLAVKYPVAFTPQALVTYNTVASSLYQRSGKADSCKESWLDFYEEGNFYRNEFIARKAITAGIRYALGAPQNKSKEIEKWTRFTVLFQKDWKYLRLLNRIPYPGIYLIRNITPIYRRTHWYLSTLKKDAKQSLLKHLRREGSKKMAI